MTYKNVFVNEITLNKIALDLYFNLENKSSLTYTIAEINTDIFVNGVFVSKAVNFSKQKIAPRTTSEIAVAILLSPKEIAKKLESNWAALALYPEKIKNKMKLKLKIKYGILSFSGPYNYTASLKDLIKNG